MKHEILEEVWRVRDQISTECEHDLKKLGAMLRREEVKYGDRQARLPIRRTQVQPTATVREKSPRYGRKPGSKA